VSDVFPQTISVSFKCISFNSITTAVRAVPARRPLLKHLLHHCVRHDIPRLSQNDPHLASPRQRHPESHRRQCPRTTILHRDHRRPARAQRDLPATMLRRAHPTVGELSAVRTCTRPALPSSAKRDTSSPSRFSGSGRQEVWPFRYSRVCRFRNRATWSETPARG
jgi:hypothetical protein